MQLCLLTKINFRTEIKCLNLWNQSRSSSYIVTTHIVQVHNLHNSLKLTNSFFFKLKKIISKLIPTRTTEAVLASNMAAVTVSDH